ncbi:hypothetical protein HQ346_24780 [Rhodococcus sp. BP-252]|nr:hypothetical protein [Rhodococcus sp. BP-320]MBY6419732.1 hypothetical protein [Rhodococcus sp. BP-321]MBY6424699.1 hypothetical protein [Rhodococcus sp. BP-324]MBY6429707.1 hypothetical protein [Rhodococcus sp. BP-323]MBY6434679.1 hypothetical protein [Rhodococcus sp. BP-322]MBY6443511.1 hypothetical protein [Rhodococcus sp. BP-319]MBY6453224.1 hypothetical protein [Rhodococcus sp. BP-315]MBY6462950.1 hypothetical protein [Rhodococcus sp. BP-260]MBY6472669.1 hypothetical protein [Rhodoc
MHWRGFTPPVVVLVVVTALGVLLMHSVTAPIGRGAEHAAMSTTPTAITGSESVPVAFGEHDCPTGHQMMHPCIGTVTSWPALTVPITDLGAEAVQSTMDRIGRRADSALERAPPWTLWELDRSVILRV